MLPNGLRVLLVSDPAADRAAAALDVHVGFFSDPEDLPGLAHFCEHMLFLGTEQFPEESGFDAFLTASSGYSNAFTDNEDTCFYFTCLPGSLEAGLERFGSFFKTPLFTASATEREVNAINSEFLKNVQDDSFRLNQVLSSRCNPSHPFEHFGAGTRSTLLEGPAKRGVDVRDALLKHYQTFYRAPLMTLCILGCEQLPGLEALARRIFGGIRGAAPEGPPEPAARWLDIPPFLPETFDRGADVVPVADVRLLEVVFPVSFSRVGLSPYVDLDAWRKYRPFGHIGPTLGHEGPNSLCALMRRRGLATGLGTAVIEENESFALLAVNIELTSEGLANRSEVLKLLFGFLRLLRELPRWPQELLDENVQLSEAAWRTLETSPPSDAVVRLVSNMHRCASPQSYISGGFRLVADRGLPDVVRATSAALVPSNAIVTTVSRSFAAAASETEPWYGSKYRLWDAAAARAEWEAARPEPGLTLNPPNRFLPRSLDLKAPKAARLLRGQLPTPPAERRRDRFWRVFFRQDTVFGVPKAFACIELLTPLPKSSAFNAVLTRLYESLVVDGLTEPLLYDARSAGLVFEMNSSARGVRLFFGGYDDRLVDFARAVMGALVGFDPAADAARFSAQCDVLGRELESFTSQQPFQQAGYWTGLATARPDFSLGQLKEALAAVKITDLGAFANQLWKRERLYGLALCQGNLREREADDLIAAVEDTLRFSPLPESEWPLPAVAKVPARSSGPGCVLVRDALDPAEENSAVELSFFLGTARRADGEAGLQLQAVAQVLSALLRDRFYAELRTKQQLGYIVTSFGDRKEGVVRLVFIVQGSALDPAGVLGRIDAFLAQTRSVLAGGQEAEVQEVASTLAEARVARAQQLGEAVERNWAEVRSRELRWDRAVVEAEAIRKVRASDVIAAFDRFVAVGGPQRRRLATLVFGAAHRGRRADAVGALERSGAELIEDPQKFSAANPSWAPGAQP